MNLVVLALTALVPLLIGFIWYNPKVLGNAWLEAAGLDEEKMKGTNMPIIFGFTYLFSFILAFFFASSVIHQMSFFSLVADMPPTDAKVAIDKLMTDYGALYRTFKHGAFHGVFFGVFIVLPLLGIPALFERKGWKYIAINVGFWIVSLAIMGGILCQFMDLAQF